MVIPDWFMSTAFGLIVAFQGWLALQIIRQGSKLVELEERVSAGERECQSRLVWLRNMNEKIDKVNSKTDRILGILEPRKENEND